MLAQTHDAAGVVSPNTRPLEREAYASPEQRAGRKIFCGAASVSGVREDGEIQVVALRCKTWGCRGFDGCAYRRAALYRSTVVQAAVKHKLRQFLTLTLDPQSANPWSIEGLNYFWNRLLTVLRRKYGRGLCFIRFLDCRADGTVHLHIVLNRYLPKLMLQWQWRRITRSSRTVPIIKYVDESGVSAYLTNYLTGKLLMSAPLWVRRVTCSRGIELLEKKTHTDWEFIREPIMNLFLRVARAGAQFTSHTLNRSTSLESFSFRSAFARAP